MISSLLWKVYYRKYSHFSYFARKNQLFAIANVVIFTLFAIANVVIFRLFDVSNVVIIQSTPKL